MRVKSREDGGSTGSSNRRLEEEILGSITDRETGGKEYGKDGIVGSFERANLIKVDDHVDRQPGVEAGVYNQAVHGSSEATHVELDGSVGGQITNCLRVGCGSLVVVVEVETTQQEEGSRQGSHVDEEAQTESHNRSLVEGVEEDVVGHLSEDGQAHNIKIW